ncbi:HET-domain-containing protein [Xylariaceae sp. FL1019]|nr:HET-domain-containing protein [Xylariaceae sp. FL1019]
METPPTSPETETMYTMDKLGEEIGMFNMMFNFFSHFLRLRAKERRACWEEAISTTLLNYSRFQCETKALRRSHKFLPRDQIAHLVSGRIVTSVLETAGVSPTDDLIEFALEKAQKIFLILSYIGNPAALSDFKTVGFHDTHLPLGAEETKTIDGKRRKVYGPLNEATLHQSSQTLKTDIRVSLPNLRPQEIRQFMHEQWYFLAPVYGGSRFYQNFHESRPLPFINETGPSRNGHFSSVYQVKLHPAHKDHENFGNGWVAVKEFKDTTKEHFRKELEALQIIRTLVDPHLITPIAAFRRGSQQCFVFPWAEGGNLRDYWTKSGSLDSTTTRDEKLLSWTLFQMNGLCRCLKRLWKLNCRHGDIKPENVLYTGGGGNLLIADVGLAKVHSEVTYKRQMSSSTKYGTRRYEAPEIYMKEQDHKAISRDYDMWSMGILLLEWLMWLVYGSDKSGMQKISQINRLPQFWESSANKFHVADSAQKIMNEMAEILSRETAMGDILHLIRDRLLVISLADEHGDLSKGRAKASELSRAMRNVYRRANREPSYMFDPKVWYRRNPSESGPALELPGRPRQQKVLGTPAALVDSNSEPFHDNNAIRDNIPTISIDFVDSTSSTQRLPALPPDEYNRRSKPFNDSWESKADNTFALKVLGKDEHADCVHAPVETVSCPNCNVKNLWGAGFRLRCNMRAMKAGSGQCNMCKMLYEALLVHIGENGEGDLIRVESTLKIDSTMTPVISLYSDPASRKNSPKFAQLGFPQLPKVGSAEELSLLRAWLRNCDQSHKCRPHLDTEQRVMKMPTRLIEIKEASSKMALRLVETANLHNDVDYVALSHCWGTVPDGLEFSTTQSTLAGHKQSIAFDQLPRTFQDAVTVTNKLGVSYIWIDSLCIIQHDEVDWETEAGKMEDVFSSAYVTIAASSADSCLKGFIHDRPTRPCVAIQDQSGDKVYLCKNIDDFHGDVEQGVLNQRGWVLQERALSRRTIHFTSNQIYWECGEGVHCETLAKLRNSKAEFLNDADFPKSALRYFRDGRIVLFQTIYSMYSQLAFTNPTDRSMGILGLERRLARTLESKGDYGILQRYLQRSLLWERAPNNELTSITYTQERRVPSWSWMSCTGAIQFIKAPFDGVDWRNDDIQIDFETGSLRNSRRNRTVTSNAEIAAFARRINTNGGVADVLKRVSFDGITMDRLEALRCVVLGIDKPNKDVADDERKHYVLLVKPLPGSNDGTYVRVGVGSLLAGHVVMDDAEGQWIRIR